MLQDPGELQQAVGICSRGDHQLNREVAASRQRGRHGDEYLDARDFRDLRLHLRHHSGDRAATLRPGFDHHAAEAVGADGRSDRWREQQLEGQRRFRHIQHDLLGGRAIHHVLVGGGVRGHVDDAEQHALILHRRQLVGRKVVHRDGAQAHYQPHQVNGGTGVQGAAQGTTVSCLEPVEMMVEPAGQAAFLVLGAAQQLGGHRR